MRKEILLVLDKDADRPIVNLPEHVGLTALLDTGARFPVWAADLRPLIALGAKLFKSNVSYSGIGGETKGDIYKIPSLVIGEKTNGLLFPELPVITNKDFDDAPFAMILSATMFHNLEYTISDKRHTLTIRVPDDESDVRNAIVKTDEDFQVLFTGSNAGL